MKNIYKQLEVLVTKLQTDPFESARFHLTLFYSAITSVVAILASALIYEIFINTIRNNIEYKIIVLQYGTEVGEEFASASAGHLLKILMFADISIIILISIAGFVFATKVLEPIRESLKKEQRFMEDATHELRTPLSVMKTGIETLPDKNMSKEEVRELKKDLLEEIEDLTHTTNNLLLLQKMEDNKHGDISKINLSNIVRYQIKQFSTYAKKRHIKYESSIEDNIYIKCDEQQIVRVIRNIIKNAIDYTKPGGKVYVELKRKNDMQAIFKVKDTGVGISKHNQKYIFDRFYTIKDDTNMQHGAGLGLSIVQSLIKKINGKIILKSKENVGTTFIIILPTTS